VKRRSKPKIFFSSFRLAAGGLGGAAQKNERKFLGLPRERSERPEARQVFRSKKVRAKVNISPPCACTAQSDVF
jgi:hypothetical protein